MSEQDNNEQNINPHNGAPLPNDAGQNVQPDSTQSIGTTNTNPIGDAGNNAFAKAHTQPVNADDASALARAETPSSSNDSGFSSRVDLTGLQSGILQMERQIGEVVIGQHDLIRQLTVGLLAGGHILIEGVPGIAKTLVAKLFARSLATDYSRIQFTPDLMPSDVLGTSIFNAKTTEFEFKKGPIFSNIVLVDEINRAPAKTQAALFEVMEEQQVTMDGTRYVMDDPFMVLATQNPVEQEGTYSLPEAQLDRFLFKVKVDYPDLDSELKILETHQARDKNDQSIEMPAAVTADQLANYRRSIAQIRIEPAVLKYIASIVTATRNHPHLYLGASPRASLAIMNAAKAVAAIEGRDFVIPEDITTVATPALNHRIILSPEREMEGMTAEQVVDMIVKSIEVPR